MSSIATIQAIFSSRLDTLSHLLAMAEKHFGDEVEGVLLRRLADDMLPFGTQIVFTCNQPRHFAQWCMGLPTENFNPQLGSWAEGKEIIAEVQCLLKAVVADDGLLTQVKRVSVGQGLYFELVGRAYVDDFLLPNFYFHLTTAYGILRMAGVPIGKRDFVTYLMPFLRKDDAEQ
jgi:hypothetical protein